MSRQLRVLVVDDSRTFRSVLAGAVEATGMARVVAHAGDGEEGIRRALEFRPDIVTLDVEMPVMDGLSALKRLHAETPGLRVIMVSAHTKQGADKTMEALHAGACDFITKPAGGDPQANREELTARLKEMFAVCLLDGAPAAPAAPRPPPAPRAAPAAAAARVPPEVVAMGSSTGGPAALARLVPRLPALLPVPVVLVQHMPPVFTASLADSLAGRSRIRVREATHGEVLRPGTVYIAPGGKHLKVAHHKGRARTLELGDEPPENFCRPAVDVLFRSVASVFGPAALGVILTGMGRDGTAGLREMKRHHVRVMGQDAASCTVYGMPREAMAAGVVDAEYPPERIADEIVAAVDGKARA